MEDGPFRVYRADGDPRLTKSEEMLQDFVNWSYKREPEFYDTLTAYYLRRWMLFGLLPDDPN